MPPLATEAEASAITSTALPRCSPKACCSFMLRDRRSISSALGSMARTANRPIRLSGHWKCAGIILPNCAIAKVVASCAATMQPTALARPSKPMLPPPWLLSPATPMPAAATRPSMLNP